MFTWIKQLWNKIFSKKKSLDELNRLLELREKIEKDYTKRFYREHPFTMNDCYPPTKIPFSGLPTLNPSKQGYEKGVDSLIKEGVLRDTSFAFNEETNNKVVETGLEYHRKIIKELEENGIKVEENNTEIELKVYEKPFEKVSDAVWINGDEGESELIGKKITISPVELIQSLIQLQNKGDLSLRKLSLHSKIKRHTLTDVLKGKRKVSQVTGEKLDMYFMQPPSTFYNQQVAYDEFLARSEQPTRK